MPGAHFAQQIRIGGQGEETGGSGEAFALNDDRAVMQRSSSFKDGDEQVARHVGVERDTAFDESAQSDVTLEHDKGTGLPAG